MGAPIPPRLLQNPLHLLSLGFGSGLSRFAPGTCGTLVAIPLYLLIAELPLTLYLLVIAVGFTLGVYLCDYTSKSLGEHDHSGIVWYRFLDHDDRGAGQLAMDYGGICAI